MSTRLEVILKSTGAIGDVVIASALQKPLSQMGYGVGILSKEFTLPLWKNIDGEDTTVYPFDENGEIGEHPKNSLVVNISDYLSEFPNTSELPKDFLGEERRGHLCEWMAYAIHKQNPVMKLNVSRDDIRIILDREEIEFGRDYVMDISKSNGGLPVVVLSPFSTSINRNLAMSTLEEVVGGIKDFAVPCQLSPYNEEQYIQGTNPVGDKRLRVASSILLACDVYVGADSGPLHMIICAIQGTPENVLVGGVIDNRGTNVACDAYVGVDSGPLHMINGAIQGTPENELVGSVIDNREKIVACVGSSHPDVVTYKDNIVIQGSKKCGFAPCGAHGYCSVDRYSEKLGTKFYPTNKDKSGCVYDGYGDMEVSPCMAAISAEEIIENIKGVLDNQKS